MLKQLLPQPGELRDEETSWKKKAQPQLNEDYLGTYEGKTKHK